MTVTDKETGATSEKEVTLKLDEGNRPKTTLADLQALQPVFKDGQRIKEGRFITAGNASQLSDGAAALVLMEAKEAEKRGLKPLGAYRGMMVAACDPDEMGIGPVFAVPKLLKKHGLTMDDIGIWELNEAFASQVLYIRDKLGIPERQAQRLRRRDLDRPSVRHVRRAHDRPPADRRQAARREVRRRDDVRRRRHGRGGAVRDLLSARSCTTEPRRRSGGATARYAEKKKAIVAAASDILNHHGVKGMTLAGVASRVGLITTSVTYYFKKKEDLAVACFLDGIARFDALVDRRAAHERSRTRACSGCWKRGSTCGGASPPAKRRPIAVFNDIRALAEAAARRRLQAYMRFFDKIREIFVAPELAWLDAQARTARAQILTRADLLGRRLAAALRPGRLRPHPRAHVRHLRARAGGAGPPAGSRSRCRWTPCCKSSAQELTPRETFLIAATRLINEQGYRGASVEKISSRLNVTKGSFYHHHEAKDELVVDCFKRSFEVMRRMQRAVRRRRAGRAGRSSRLRRRRWSTISCPSAARCCAPRRSPRCLSRSAWKWWRRPTASAIASPR